MRHLARALLFSSLLPPSFIAFGSGIARADPPQYGKPAAPDPADTDEEDDTKPVPPADAPAPGQRPTPSYRGVSPGTEGLPPRFSKTPKGPAKMTWVGFQVRAGVPTVFLELSRPVVWSVAESPDKLVYTLVGATIPLTNNSRPLRVQEFNTPVASVEARKKGRDVEVTIRTKKKVTHKEKNEEAAGGLKLLVVELAPAA